MQIDVKNIENVFDDDRKTKKKLWKDTNLKVHVSIPLYLRIS